MNSTLAKLQYRLCGRDFERSGELSKFDEIGFELTLFAERHVRRNSTADSLNAFDLEHKLALSTCRHFVAPLIDR